MFNAHTCLGKSKTTSKWTLLSFGLQLEEDGAVSGQGSMEIDWACAAVETGPGRDRYCRGRHWERPFFFFLPPLTISHKAVSVQCVATSFNSTNGLGQVEDGNSFMLTPVLSVPLQQGSDHNYPA